MQVALIGNVNNNGYLIAKGLRTMGLQPDLLLEDYDYYMAAPEWEEGTLGIEVKPGAFPRWGWTLVAPGWARPPWIKAMPPHTWHRLPHARVDPFVREMEYRLNQSLKNSQLRLVNDSLRRRGLPELDPVQSGQFFDIFRWGKSVV